MIKTKLTSAILSLAMVLAMCGQAAAANMPGDAQENQEPDVLDIIVPTEMGIYMDADGDVRISQELAIQNLSDRPVEVEAIQVNGKSGWQVLDYNFDYDSMPMNTHALGMAFRGDNTDAAGHVALSPGNWQVDGNSSLPIQAQARMPLQSETGPSNIASITWTINPVAEYLDFVITAENRHEIGYTGAANENLVIPETFIGSDGNHYKVVGIDYRAFYNCQGLKSVTIPGTVAEIGYQAFFHCEALTDVNIEYGVSHIGPGAFSFCYDLLSVSIPNSVTEIDTMAFHYDLSLTEFVWPSSVTTISEWMFENCPNLKHVVIPDTVQVIEERAFQKCGFSELTLPDSLTTIQAYAFAFCCDLTLTVPDSVSVISHDAFQDVPHVIYGGTAKGAPWGADLVTKS